MSEDTTKSKYYYWNNKIILKIQKTYVINK